MDIIQGTIILKVLKATLTRDTELFAKMAPYCTITVGNITSKTTVKKNYGKTPEWFEVFSFPSKLGDELKLKVWDKDAVGSDDLVGEGSVTNKKEFLNMKYCFWVPLKFKNENGGQIQIDIEFVPNHDSLNILMGMLENELKEKQALLMKYEHKPGDPIQINEEILNSKEATTQKIQEINDQINQLKIEFQTKSVEIEQKTKANVKINEDLKKNLVVIESQLAEYGIFLFYILYTLTLFQEMETINGILKINVIDGTFIRDVGGMFDKQDPFAIFSLGNSQVLTKVKMDSGKKAVWNENLEITRSYQDELVVEVLDFQEDKKHHCIGYTQVSIKECIHSKEVKKFHKTKIWYRGEEAGEVNFEVQFIRS